MRHDLQLELENRFGYTFDSEWHRLTGGYESDVWRVGDVVVRINPEWRTDYELLWMHDLLKHCATIMPEVPAPIKAINGSTLFRWENRPVTLFPFVTGEILNRHDDYQVEQAAQLLAQIHTTGLKWRGISPRPPHDLSAPTIPKNQIDPDSIIDPDLDRWFNESFLQETQITGVVHGDYYRANILYDDDRISGVIDWDESTIRPLITEVAWSMWEFTHNADGDDLDIQRALNFLGAYRAERNTLTDNDLVHLIPLIRRHLRYEIRRSIADEARGDDVDMEYRNAEISAFNNLRGVDLRA